jgi:hypothetical protein
MSNNDLPAFKPPLGPQPANTDLHSQHVETIPLRNKIFHWVKYNTVLRTFDGEHAFTISKTPTPSAVPHFSTSSSSSKVPLLTFLQSRGSNATYKTDMAMNRRMKLDCRPRLLDPKADLGFCNAPDDKQYVLEVEGGWRSDMIRIVQRGRFVAVNEKGRLNGGIVNEVCILALHFKGEDRDFKVRADLSILSVGCKSNGAVRRYEYGYVHCIESEESPASD